MTIGDGSCISAHACQGSDNAVIGTSGCLGDEACKDNTADISDNSCQGKESCTMNKAKIGTRSCQSESKACFHNEGSIGDESVSGCKSLNLLLRDTFWSDVTTLLLVSHNLLFCAVYGTFCV